MIFGIAPFPPIMFKGVLKNSQWIDVYSPSSQMKSFRNSNVFSFVLRFCVLSAALIVVGELIPIGVGFKFSFELLLCYSVIVYLCDGIFSIGL